MIPLVDCHVHLFAGLDDGPRTEADALEMCRLSYAEGVRSVLATAHQNEEWSKVTPDGIRKASWILKHNVDQAKLPIDVYPNAEVMAEPDSVARWKKGDLLSVADRGKHLLVEMPHGLCVDIHHLVREFRDAGITPILAHPERQGDLLHNSEELEQLIDEGCLVQISAGSVTHPATPRDGSALKGWLRRDMVHLIGSDGHSPNRRPPMLAAAHETITSWCGSAIANRICSTNGHAIIHGLPMKLAKPKPARRRWFGLWSSR